MRISDWSSDVCSSDRRPASYCGVVGFKPSFGAVPRSGVLSQAPSLDTVGVFAGSVAEAALLAENLYGYDEGDPAPTLAPAPERQSAVQGQRVSVRVDLGGRRLI